MNIVFTICSLNYLANAKALAQSIIEHNTNLKFVFVIADKINQRLDTTHFDGHDFIEVEDLKIPFLSELLNTYNIIEFNTSIKPFAFEFIAKKYQAEKIVYLDPDILVFSSLNDCFSNLDKFNFILTPHILYPIINDRFYANQRGAIMTGVFNLGFIAIKMNDETKEIINWWGHHMKNHGHCDILKGEFYDQKIMNFLPVFSEKVLIDKNPGMNVAGWNIHERKITKKNNKLFINGSSLVFYHYSGLKNNSTNISSYNDLKREEVEYIDEILLKYEKLVAKYEKNGYSQLSCAFNLHPNIHRDSRLTIYKHRLKKWLNLKR